MKTEIINGKDVKCTLVCINNNQKLYEEFIYNLKQQENIGFQLITIENMGNHICGARIAFNEIIDEILGEYVYFIHQDIRFLNKSALVEIYDRTVKLKNLGVVGVAGCTSNGSVYSTIVHGKQKKRPGKLLNNYIEVQTVDECLFGIKTEILKKNPFSKDIGWHLYAVEQCLKYTQIGLTNYVIKSDIWHLSSGGSLDYTYFKNLKKLIKKYPMLSYINTTVYKCPTKGIKSFILINYFLCKLYLRKMVKGK